MQHIVYFDQFLREKVNLSQAKLDQLSERVDRVYKALKADPEIGSLITGLVRQGSWAHRTIITPLRGKEFDADFLLNMKENPDWSDNPKMYIEQVYTALKNHHLYGEMDYTRNCRSVRLTYANDMHIDIVPHLNLGNGREVIVNRDDNDWESADPTSFTQWMKHKDDAANNNLRKVIRLMKYLRDHRKSFTGTPSVILTTLLGESVSELKSLIDPATYGNVPTALLNIFKDLDSWLQARPSQPSISDPSTTGKTFDHRWNEQSYGYFRERIHAHTAQIEEAYNENDPKRSVELWQNIFGSGFRPYSSISTQSKFSSSTASSFLHTRSGRAG